VQKRPQRSRSESRPLQTPHGIFVKDLHCSAADALAVRRLDLHCIAVDAQGPVGAGGYYYLRFLWFVTVKRTFSDWYIFVR